jgi:hypothetical protein
VVPHSYYLSLLDLNSHYYHTIPMVADSKKSAVYISGAYTKGGSNYNLRDDLFGFHGNIHRSQDLGHFQTYYGLGLILGSYMVSPYDSYFSSPPDYRNDTVFRIGASNHFWGSLGFNGGINLVVPFRSGEWRIIGLETSLQYEFGDYLNFRKSLKDSAVDILATNHGTKTLGISTEFLRRSKKGVEFGYKLSFGASFVSGATYQGDSSRNTPVYFSNTFHLTRERVTGFVQFNIGTHCDSFQMGLNFRRGKNKRALTNRVTSKKIIPGYQL